MSGTLGLAVYNTRQHQQWSEVELPAIVSGEDLITVLPGANTEEQLRIEWSDKNKNRAVISNFGPSIVLPDGRRILAGSDVELPLPNTFFLGESIITLFDSSILSSLNFAISELPEWHCRGIDATNLSEISPATNTVASWFATLARLQRTPAGCSQLYQQAARTIFDPGGLDVGMILMKQAGEWKVESSYVPRNQLDVSFNTELLDQVMKTGCTLYHDANKLIRSDEKQFTPVPESIASPIFNETGECIGVVYGSRVQHQQNQRRGIRPLEARFMSLIAESLSASFARSEIEAKVTRSQVLLEQAFPPSVAKELIEDRKPLDPKLHDVSILFCDIRDFTNIAETVSPEIVFDLLADLMNGFSEIVIDHQGVIIDYFGDGFSAFWNAPVAQPNHPELACRSALEIVKRLDSINRKWASIIDKEVRIGVGIHTGISLVGNSGSETRLKYGPRGNQVVIAQRIQDTTKSVGVPILISAETASRVAADFLTIDVFDFQLKGFRDKQPVATLLDPFALEQTETVDCEHYQLALDSYKRGQWELASKSLAKIKNREIKVLAEFLASQIDSETGNSTASSSHDQGQSRPFLHDSESDGASDQYRTWSDMDTDADLDLDSSKHG